MTRSRRREPTQRRLIVLGLVVVVAAAGALTLGYSAQSGLPWKDKHTLTVALPAASNMGRHDPVRIDGKRVGQIVAVSASRAAARLTVELDDSVWPLHAGTTALPRARSALGQSYLELRPGLGGGTLPDGGTVGPATDAEPVSVDEVLSTLDAPVRAQAQELLGQLGTGVAARGPQIAETLTAAPATLTDLTGVARALVRPDEPLGRLVDGAGVAVEAARPAARTFAQSFDPEARTLAPVVAEAPAVRAALSLAPSALRHVTHDLPATTRLLSELNGLARDSGPLLRVAPRSLSRTAALLPVAGTGLAAVDAPLKDLFGAIPPAMTLLRRFSGIASLASRTLAYGTTTVRDLSHRPCDLKRWLVNWGGPDGILGFRNNAGGFLRFTLVSPETPLTGATTGSTGPKANVYVPASRCGADR